MCTNPNENIPAASKSSADKEEKAAGASSPVNSDDGGNNRAPSQEETPDSQPAVTTFTRGLRGRPKLEMGDAFAPSVPDQATPYRHATGADQAQGVFSDSATVTGVVSMPTVKVIIPTSGPGESSSYKRKVRPHEVAGATSSNGAPKRARGELDAPGHTGPACCICGKRFASWKAVFGHMRAHPERDWRGAFPPPKIGNWSPVRTTGVTEDEQRRLLGQLAPTLLTLAREKLEKMHRPAGQIATTPAARIHRTIDLNVEPQEDPSASFPSAEKEGTTGFDLNLPPKDEEYGDNEAS